MMLEYQHHHRARKPGDTMITKDTELAVTKAIVFAIQAHSGRARKGTAIPEVVHPVSVAMTLLKAGAPEDAVVAGLLHDTVEDTGTKLEDIRSQFGTTVESIVRDCTEPNKEAPWEDRKRETISKIQKLVPESLMVVCADKIDNLRDIERDRRHLGDKVWSRFKRGQEDQKWYYREIVQNILTLNGDQQGPIVRLLSKDLDYEFRRVFGNLETET